MSVVFGEKKIPSHKLLLGACSTVLEALFEGKASEVGATTNGSAPAPSVATSAAATNTTTAVNPDFK